MNQKIRAVFRSGSFVPSEPCDLPEDSQVSLTVTGPIVVPPRIVNREERLRELRQITQRMRQNPLPANAPRLTRDDMHDRG